MVIEDSVPRFAALEGTIDTTPGRYDAGIFGETVEGALSESEGSVFLLLGGIGAGKSTFLKRFFHFVRRHFIEHMGVWFYVPFLKAPQLQNLESYVYATVLDQIRDRYGHLDLETREALLDAYRGQIEALNKTLLNAERLTDSEYQRRLNIYLEKWTADAPAYVRALLGSLRRRGKAIVICIDNVDQLAPDYQHEIFLLSQRIAGQLRSVTIVALREESFYTASIQRTFTAYTSRKFHISSPAFRKLISTRLKYARGVLARPDNEVRLILRSGMSMDREAIDHFLQILEMSLFGHNRNIARFIECVSYGNMREALDMFASFLYSGNTDVDKMLGIYSENGRYYVAFHEFAKAVILGDRRFYREAESKVLNVFDVGPERNSSHFTSLRLLSFLMQYHGAASAEGRGYAPISLTLGAFVDIMDNEEDFLRTADRLIRKALIEVDTRSSESIQGANYVRITPSGWYYLEYLSRAFAYLDLMLQDTPVNSRTVYSSLLDQIKRVELAVDTAATKEEKLELRFKRVDTFLDYLEHEEESECRKYGLDKIESALARPIVRAIREQYSREVASIKKRVGGAFATDMDEPEVPEIPPDLSILGDAEDELDEISNESPDGEEEPDPDGLA